MKRLAITPARTTRTGTTAPQPGPGEWWINDLACEIGMPPVTLYCRRTPGKPPGRTAGICKPTTKRSLPAIGQHHRQIPDHDSRIMTTTPLLHRSQPQRQRLCEPHLLSDPRDQRGPRVRDQTRSVRRDFYGNWAFITHHPQGEPPSSGSRTFDKPRIPAQPDVSAPPPAGGAVVTARPGLERPT